jgi:putative FmdB family regulatory protein
LQARPASSQADAKEAPSICAAAAGWLSVPLSPAKTPYNRGFSKIRREKLVPIYAYRCEACGFAKDALQKVSDAPLTDCPSCGEAKFKKQLTAAGFQLKGTGWYVTDFRNGASSAKPSTQDATKSEGASTGASDNAASSSGSAGSGDSAASPGSSNANSTASSAGSSGGGDSAGTQSTSAA